MRRVIHIDMDCFFAAVEMRDQPRWRGIPLAVGGEAGKRGVIATCNYEARRFGVRSAMATAYAQRLCPHLKVVAPRFAQYKAVSTQLRAIFERYTSLVEMVSLDEAYLDVTGSPHCRGSATWIAAEIRQTIARELALTASAGVAPNKFLAKVASERNKPDGLCVIPPQAVGAVLADLPVRAIPGVGPVMESHLLALGIKTSGELQRFPLVEMTHRFGKWGEQLWHLAHGEDERAVVPHRDAKSVGSETTFASDLRDFETCRAAIRPVFADVQRRLGRHSQSRGMRGWQLKVRYSDRVLMTLSAGHQPLDEQVVDLLLRKVLTKSEGRGIRLLGIQVALQEPTGQLSLWPSKPMAPMDISPGMLMR